MTASAARSSRRLLDRLRRRTPTAPGTRGELLPPSARGGRADLTTAGQVSAILSGAKSESSTAAPRRRRTGERLGLYELREDAIATTTRQAEALSPALISTEVQLVGPVYGLDATTGQVVYHDVHGLYEAKRITSPVVLVAGAVGTGKSSNLKTVYVLRPLAIGDQVACFDRKSQAGAGEYRRAVGVADGVLIRFARTGAGRTRINLLDPRIVAAGDDEIVGQDTLLGLVAELALGRPLTIREKHALKAALRAARSRAKGDGRIAILSDVIDALYTPDLTAVPHPAAREYGVDEAAVFGWGLDVALALSEFVDGTLSGLVDGQTSDDLNLDAPLIVFDISALDETSMAIPVVMAVVNTFLTAVWAAKPGRRRKLVIEEGYFTVTHPTVAEIMKRNAKQGRGAGLAVITALHHLSDVPESSAAISLIQEAGVVHLYKQDKERDAAAAVRYFNLPAVCAEVLMTELDSQGDALVKIGSEPPRIVHHLRSQLEDWVTDTDALMRGDTELDDTLPAHLAELADLWTCGNDGGESPDGDPWRLA